MKCLIVILLVGCSTAQYTRREKDLEVPKNPDEWKFLGHASITRSGRIQYGYTATDTQFPFVARMSINTATGGLLCSGSLIATNWIISARHCIADTNAVSVQAALGSADRDSPSRVVVFSDMFIWLNAVGSNQHPDIALFRLYTHLALNSYVNIIQLPTRSQESNKFGGYSVVCAGWGGIAGGSLPRYLQWGNFRVLYDSEMYYNDEMIVFQPRDAGSSTYIRGGDSGGPMFLETSPRTLIGINVIGFWVNNIEYQGSTRVTKFLNFITESTGIPIRN